MSALFSFLKQKKYRFLTPARKVEESILDRPEFMYPDTREREKRRDRREGDDAGIQVNYLRKPASEIGVTALISAAVSLLLTALCVHLALRALGNPPLYVSAVGASAILFSLYAMICAVLSFPDREKNHLYGILGLCIGGLVLITWIFTMIAGAQI